MRLKCSTNTGSISREKGRGEEALASSLPLPSSTQPFVKGELLVEWQIISRYETQTSLKPKSCGSETGGLRAAGSVPICWCCCTSDDSRAGCWARRPAGKSTDFGSLLNSVSLGAIRRKSTYQPGAMRCSASRRAGWPSRPSTASATTETRSCCCYCCCSGASEGREVRLRRGRRTASSGHWKILVNYTN